MAKQTRRDYSQLLIWAALAVTSIRYAGAFLASDTGVVEGFLSELLSYGMIVTGLGMGILDTLGAAYIFDGWRRALPKRGANWSFRFRTLTGMVIALFISGIMILTPYTVSRVAGRDMFSVLGTFGLWVWAFVVNLAPYILIGGVVVSQTQGIVHVSSEQSSGITLPKISFKRKKHDELSHTAGAKQGSYDELSHTEQLPYECDICEERFQTPALKASHVRWQHPSDK